MMGLAPKHAANRPLFGVVWTRFMARNVFRWPSHSDAPV